MIERKGKIEFERTEEEVREGGRSSGDAENDRKIELEEEERKRAGRGRGRRRKR